MNNRNKIKDKTYKKGPITIQEIRNTAKRILKSPGKALAFLVSAGIYDKKGNLTKHYK